MVEQTGISNLASIGLRCSSLTQIATKTGPNHDSGAADSSSSDSVRYSLWGIPTNLQNPYTQLSNHILNFLYPPNEAIDPTLTGMNLYFSPENTKDFLDQYPRFQDHIPLMHPSTFRIMESHLGLAASMCCIGACYSTRVELPDVQQMMDALWTAMERDCRVMSDDSLQDADVAEATESNIEELQAVLLTTVLHVCNGTSQQRQRALRLLPLMAAQARRLNLLGLSGDPAVFSPLHQPNSQMHSNLSDDFDWRTWIGQESRLRLMHALFALDTVWSVFWNGDAQYGPYELHLPLPCDDIAWDAKDRHLCASALDLQGADVTKAHNPLGTGLVEQPLLHLALKALVDPSTTLKSGCTNRHGKSILATALLSTIWQTQRYGGSGHDRLEIDLAGKYWIVPFDRSGTPAIDPLDCALTKLRMIWAEDLPAGKDVPRNDLILFMMARVVLLQSDSRELPPEDRFVEACKTWNAVSSLVSNGELEQGEEILTKMEETKIKTGDESCVLELVRVFPFDTHEPDQVGLA